jgi:hypothetical protein
VLTDGEAALPGLGGGVQIVTNGKNGAPGIRKVLLIQP